ncbi:MinD-like ATPase involved in chromosome partitioning or flagellar assembly [Cellulomonas sp. PhB143]|nr:MinD-like ATPase involved in chromosome partitioning or flagellar assembly [Cellulomonas sp. PhB143]
MAALLAHAEHRGARPAVLVGLDRGGGGLDVVLGIEDLPGARWPDLDGVRGDIDGRAVLAALPVWRGVGVVSADRTRPVRSPGEPGVVADVLRALRGAAGLVVLDAGVAGAAAPDLLGACDAVVLVVPLEVRGVAGAVAALAERAQAGAAGPGTVVVARDVPGGGVGERLLADVVGAPVLDTLPWHRVSRREADAGYGPPTGRRTPTGRFARRLADALAVLPAVPGPVAPAVPARGRAEPW